MDRIAEAQRWADIRAEFALGKTASVTRPGSLWMESRKPIDSDESKAR